LYSEIYTYICTYIHVYIYIYDIQISVLYYEVQGWKPCGRKQCSLIQTRSDRFCGSPSLQYTGYRISFLGVKRLWRGFDHPLTSSAEFRMTVFTFTSLGTENCIYLEHPFKPFLHTVVLFLCSFIYNLCVTIQLFIHSYCSMSYDRSIASSKASSPHCADVVLTLSISNIFSLS
jgi:hypothetical protein